MAEKKEQAGYVPPRTPEKIEKGYVPPRTPEKPKPESPNKK